MTWLRFCGATGWGCTWASTATQSWAEDWPQGPDTSSCFLISIFLTASRGGTWSHILFLLLLKWIELIFFLGLNLWHVKVPRLEVKSELQGRIWAVSVTYTTAHGKTGSLTHWGRPGIEPASSWIIVRLAAAEPPQELMIVLIFKNPFGAAKHKLSCELGERSSRSFLECFPSSCLYSTVCVFPGIKNVWSFKAGLWKRGFIEQ